MSCIAYYNLVGVSKAKTDRAILFLEDGVEKAQWFPLSVLSNFRFGKDFKVTISVPDWHLRRINHPVLKSAFRLS